MLPRGTFVLGGAGSGKSAWAERLLENHSKSISYVATGRIFDAEVAHKVEIHKSRRHAGWTTVEAPLDLRQAFCQMPPDQPVLIDCATMWLTNHLMEQSDLAAAQADLIAALDALTVPWVIVSNEVGQGIVPENAMARGFRDAQGKLNIALAAQADLAVQVVAGLPQILKGTLP